VIEINIKDKNIIYSDSYLSVIQRADRFFYAILDNNHTIKETSLEPISKSDLYTLVSKGFSKKMLAIDGPSIHLPSGINGEKLLVTNEALSASTISRKEKLIGQQVTTHYSIPVSVFTDIDGVFGSHEIIHLSTAIGNYMYPAVHDKVLVLIGDSCMYFCYSNEDGLRFINRYLCSEASDFLYYISLCYNKLKLNQELVRLDLGGMCQENSPILDLLSNYYPKWRFVDPALFKISEDSNVKPHVFFDHYLNYLCVL
jgi:hypothetical protein